MNYAEFSPRTRITPVIDFLQNHCMSDKFHAQSTTVVSNYLLHEENEMETTALASVLHGIASELYRRARLEQRQKERTPKSRNA